MLFLQGRKSKGGKTKKSKNDEEDDEDLTADMVSVEKNLLPHPGSLCRGPKNLIPPENQTNFPPQ
jgi:hypothetical protein